MARLCDGLHQGCGNILRLSPKRPALRNRQGMWTLFGEAGQVLKRGHELAGVLFPIERRLLKVVES